MDKVNVKCGFLCNNKCWFCVQGNKRQLYGDISTDQIFKTLELGRIDADQVVLTGGEPTIKRDFLAIVRKARALGYRLIQIQTNGRMFSDRCFCEETVAAGANDFSLALHGHIPPLHDYLTRVPGSFRQTVKGILNLKALKQYVGTNAVITRSNYRHLPELGKLLVRLGVDQYQFAFVHALGTAGENFRRVVPRYPLIEPYVKRGLDYGIGAGIRVMTEAIPYCFMSGYTQWIAEKIIPQTKIFDLVVVENYSQYRRTEGKGKGESCNRCIYNVECEGSWKEYTEIYKWDEFKPVCRV